MRKLISAMLIVVGVIHLLPLSGALGAERLSVLYGASFEDANLVLLMRHRAILFGLFGLFLIYAAFRPSLQSLAWVAGFVSVVSFLGLAYSMGGYNAQISRVVVADWVALFCLFVAAGAFVAARAGRVPGG